MKKIFTISIIALLTTSSVIPIAHASDDEAPTTGPLKGVTHKKASTSASQPLDSTPSVVVGPLRRAISAPNYGISRSRLLTEEPIPALSIMVRCPSLSHPPRVKEVHAGQDIGAAEMEAAAEHLIPLSQPIAGFIPLSGHLSSQFDESNTDAALARLDIDIMKGRILPTVERLLAHTWTDQPIPTLDIKDDLVAVVAELKAGKPQQAAVLSAALIEKVNAAETTGPLDELSRLRLYSVQTVLHLLAGTPYIALNNFLELRQLGISWHSASLLVPNLFSSPGKFYKYLTNFVSSDKATSIWAGDDRIRKLWQGHAQFAWDQNEFRKISEGLEGLGDAAGSEGELTFRHTLYVLGKMQLRFGEHLRDAAAAEPLLAAAGQTLGKIDGYRFEGLFSYRNVATKVFLGDAAWSRYKLGSQVHHLSEALTYYTDAVPLIEAGNETGAEMIKSSFNHAKFVISAYAESSVPEKMAKLALFREKLIPLSDELPHIDASGISSVLNTEIEKLAPTSPPPAEAVASVDSVSSSHKDEKKKKKRDRGEDAAAYQEAQVVDNYGDGDSDDDEGSYDYFRFREYQKPLEPVRKKK